jgi:hypothetical protein
MLPALTGAARFRSKKRVPSKSPHCAGIKRLAHEGPSMWIRPFVSVGFRLLEISCACGSGAGSVARQSLPSPHIRRPASTTLSSSWRRSPRARDVGTAVPDEASTLFCPWAGAPTRQPKNAKHHAGFRKCGRGGSKKCPGQTQDSGVRIGYLRTLPPHAVFQPGKPPPGEPPSRFPKTEEVVPRSGPQAV